MRFVRRRVLDPQLFDPGLSRVIAEDLSIEEAAAAIKQANDSPNSHCFAIADNKSGELLGNIALVIEEQDQNAGEIMFWLAPNARGRGIATSATRLLCTWAFDKLDLGRVTAKVLKDNDRSHKVLERLGFQVDRSRENQDPGFIWFVIERA